MEILLWILIIGLFIISFIGIFFPSSPSVLALWGGFLIYHFFLNSNNLSTFFWVAMVILTVVLLVANLITSSIAVDEFGGSKWGQRVSTIAIIIGAFIYPPFGILLLPFIGVLIVEIWQQNNFSDALKAALGTFVGFLGGRIAKAFIQLTMIVWFFLAVLF